jgi:hypothetical protein
MMGITMDLNEEKVEGSSATFSGGSFGVWSWW